MCWLRKRAEHGVGREKNQTARTYSGDEKVRAIVAIEIETIASCLHDDRARLTSQLEFPLACNLLRTNLAHSQCGYCVGARDWVMLGAATCACHPSGRLSGWRIGRITEGNLKRPDDVWMNSRQKGQT